LCFQGDTMRLTHVRLLVDDFDACLGFYRDTLRLPLALEAGDGVYAEFDAGDATLALYRRDLMSHVVGAVDNVTPSDSDDVVITFAVDGADETVQELRDRGVEFVTGAHDQDAWMIRVAHFRDPDGHLIEIYAPIQPPE
ncbi:MAG: VOC family protein, partial [Actinomycetota bacterium]|nr:VOC family protein [Actinomycetota bacterium]